MPRLNGTGPYGTGPMTGRGMGPCGGSNRMGWCGNGRWPGLRRAHLSSSSRLELLEEEEKILKEELEALKMEKAALQKQK